MGMTITGATNVQKHLQRIEKAVGDSPKRLIKIVSEARNRMKDRTNKGQTAAGGTFTPLDPVYAERKMKDNKSGIPDLHYEGHMLNAMQVKGISGGAEIYFNDEKQRKKAVAHHFGRGVPRRSFFTLGKKIEKYIFDEFRKPIRKAIQ